MKKNLVSMKKNQSDNLAQPAAPAEPASRDEILARYLNKSVEGSPGWYAWRQDHPEQANQRAIRAVPELVAALRNLLSSVDQQPDGPTWAEEDAAVAHAARAVLDKVDGKEGV